MQPPQPAHPEMLYIPAIPLYVFACDAYMCRYAFTCLLNCVHTYADVAIVKGQLCSFMCVCAGLYIYIYNIQCIHPQMSRPKYIHEGDSG